MRPYPSMNADNTALVVIDVINSCAHEKCEIPEWNIHFTKIRQMVPNLVTFIDDYRKTIRGLVVFTTTVPWQKEHLPQNLNELYTDPKTTYYTKDTSGFAEEFYLVKPQSQNITLAKHSYDAFSGTELDQKLKAKGIKYLVMTGIFADGCVMNTISVGFSRGYNFVILKDLIETTDVPIRQNLQQDLKTYTWPVMFGKTLDSSEFINSWKR